MLYRASYQWSGLSIKYLKLRKSMKQNCTPAHSWLVFRWEALNFWKDDKTAPMVVVSLLVGRIFNFNLLVTLILTLLFRSASMPHSAHFWCHSQLYFLLKIPFLSKSSFSAPQLLSKLILFNRDSYSTPSTHSGTNISWKSLEKFAFYRVFGGKHCFPAGQQLVWWAPFNAELTAVSSTSQ